MNRKRWLFLSLFVVLSAGIWAGVYFMQPTVSGFAGSSPPAYVFKDKVWELRFTKPMDASTITEDSVYVQNEDNQRVPVSTSLNDDGTVLTVSAPEEGYTNFEAYTLHLSEDLKSKLGLGIRGEQTMAFEVVDELPAAESTDYLKEYFTAILDQQKTQERDNSVFQEESSAGDTAQESSSDAMGGGEDFSQTNNQVDGVSEADIVQTDGEYIYHITGNQLVHIVESGDRETMEPVSAISFEEEFYPSQLFLKDDTLVVIGDKWMTKADPDEKASRESQPAADMSVTIAKIYSVSSPAEPELIREAGAEGYFNSARMIDSHLYFVTNFSPNFWLLEEDPDFELRPHTWDSRKGDSFEPVAAEEISVIPENEQGEYAVITAVDISSPDSEITTETYLGTGGQLYMSENSLYLATSNAPYTIMPTDSMPAGRGASETTIYKFDIDDSSVTYSSKGTVKGGVLNQFSMDEHDGHFRIATTEGNTFGDNRNSLNHLFILNEQMEPAGSVEGLAKGERIYSARFMGDKAYMVTFRETDPLFVIDTADPEAPEVLGELKIPGFSTYLHPLDENHLIGFGMETDLVKNDSAADSPQVRQTGMKISLFDISDFSNPKEKDTEVIGGPGTFSTLMDNHKALFQHKERSLFGFPVVVYDEKPETDDIQFVNQGAMLYTITPDGGIELASEIMDETQDGQQYEDWDSQIQRMLYIDDTLYTVRSNKIESHELPE
ncbi:beta-propeller domain-containing protein [Jeotgalibacillus proteolyticus]|uniref:beta-propeller domain-containing protein n=1 Tax=Jeotgalibacillus proteolyticus TaxID=2082395 RepID=UPI003CF04DDE